jgi:hypothetical protein
MCQWTSLIETENRENCRVLLQVYTDRINSIASIVNSTTGYFIILLTAIVTLSFQNNFYKTDEFQIVILICISLLVLWRLYVHYLDREIISLYEKVIRCENTLNIDENLSLVKSIISQFPSKLKNQYNHIPSFQEKVQKILPLIPIKRVGYRGQDKFDLFATCLIIISIIFLFYRFSFGFVFPGIPLLMLIIAIFLISFVLVIFLYYNLFIRIPPSIDDWDSVINSNTHGNLEFSFTNTQVILLFFVIIIAGLFLGYFFGWYLTSNSYQQTLNEYFQIQYDSSIKQDGELKIHSMVNESMKFNNDTEKLNKIADLVTQNFTGIFFTETQNSLFFNDCDRKIPFNHRYFGHYCTGYGYDKKGKVRVNGGSLTNNPFWIASQKTGACGDLSVLFENVTNQSGIPTRSVCPNIDHQWNEVFIDDEWKYFDLTEYHDHHDDPEKQNIWIGKQENYCKNTGWNFTQILICGSDPKDSTKNLTSFYCS